MFSSIQIISFPDEVLEYSKQEERYLLLCAQKFDFEGLQKTMFAPWYGVVFPKIFLGENLYEDKAFLCTLSKDLDIDFVKDEEELSCLDCKTYMVLVDGMDSHVNTKLERLFSQSPQDAFMFGAGAGRANMDNKRCMFDGNSFVQEGVIVLSSHVKLSLGVKHGYNSNDDFHIITASNGNIIEKIDGMDAFVLYQKLIKEKFDVALDAENIFSVGLRFPLMFERTFGEKIVRIPVKTDGASLYMVGEVEQGTVFCIGTVSETELIAAAQESVTFANKNLENKPALCIVFSCLGREQYLNEHFQEELKIINLASENAKIIGALSMGEISNSSNDNLEFYNCTCVVGVE